MSDELSRSTFESSTWFPRILGAVQDLVYVFRLDPPGYVYVSPSVERITGYTTAECYADPFFANRHIHPEDKARLEASLTDLTGINRLELRIVHRSGAIKWIEQENTPIRDDQGGVVALYGIARDITERKAGEMALRDSEMRYRTLFESARDAIVLLDGSTIIDCNPAVLRIYGWHSHELIGSDAQNAAPEFQPDGERSADKSSRAIAAAITGQPQQFEFRALKRSGEEVDIDIFMTSVMQAGRLLLQVIARDLTDRRRAEAERLALQTRLAKAEKMESVGRLSGAVAHDFNNLLTVIAGYTALLSEDAAADSPTSHKLGEILRAAERARDLTQKLLVFSRKQPSRPRVIEIDTFMRDEASVIPRLVGEQIKVKANFTAKDACAHLDPAQLTQILSNLVLNARDAMPDGGTLTLSTALVQVSRSQAAQHPGVVPGDFVRLSVADSGIGMDEAIQAHLFEPFFTTKRLGTGAGLGLATVYGLVQQAGGFIEVDTAPAQGTTMAVSLPVTLSPCVQDDKAEYPAIRGGSETVLIVEDEDSVRALTHTVLARLGYKVTDATGPAEAIGLARDGRRFDIVVSDVVMPGMNGRRMVHELEQITPGFKVLYVSGYAEAEAAGAGELQADPKHFLAKPFTPVELSKKVRALLDA
ncbi:MAG TPA: PAS domain S-box protein [Vicinamibacterales bacterium]|nr:PAS domain S-box protein [Vicinamibacterales bacterium]